MSRKVCDRKTIFLSGGFVWVLVIDGILFEMMKRKFRLAHNWTKEKKKKKRINRLWYCDQSVFCEDDKSLV